jgi:hypothetical protein
LLNSASFVDKAPAAVYHELLDEGVYMASVSTMYRILVSMARWRSAGARPHMRPGSNALIVDDRFTTETGPARPAGSTSADH